jgi:hypothetical protein
MSDRRGFEGLPKKINPDKTEWIGTHLTTSLYEKEEIPDLKGYAADQLLFDDTLDESHI